MMNQKSWIQTNSVHTVYTIKYMHMQGTCLNVFTSMCGIKVQYSILPQFPCLHTVGTVQTTEKQEGGG